MTPPPPTAKGPSAASPLPVSGAVTGGRGGRRFTWGRGVPAPWSPPPWPRESASASSLPAAPFAVAGLHCLDGMGSQACPFPAKSFLREEVEKNREGGEWKSPKGTDTRIPSPARPQPLYPRQGRDPSTDPLGTCVKSSPSSCHCGGACVSPWPRKSLRPRLGVLTKGERRDHPPS